VFSTDTMKETAAKRREKPKESKGGDKQKDAGPEPQDVDMPEEDAAANAVKGPKELDNLTLDGGDSVRIQIRSHGGNDTRVVSPLAC